MELNQQVFKAPAIPKIGKKKVSSSAMRGALKPQAKLRRSSFSFIKPLQKTVDTEKIASGATATNPSIAANLAETNNILVEIQKQLALDFAYRIAEEKKDLAAEKKRISAQKVADKEARIEKGGKNLLGKTFSKVTAPFKSIFQKLIDFFSIILTGILLNTAFKWLSKEENREKLKKFFNFLKDYWQELLIIFGAYKLARLVGKIYKIGRTFKKLFDIFKKKPPKLPCKCPKTSPTTDICGKIKDCLKNPTEAVVKALAVALAAGGYILGQGSLDLLKGLLGGGLIPAAAATPTPVEPLTAAKPVQKPTYEQIKANFDPRRDFSYYQKLGLSKKEWTRLQMDPSVGGGVRGDLQTFADKPGQTWGMALNALSFLPLFGMMGGGARMTTAAAPSVLRTTGANVAKNQIAKLPLNVNIGTSKILKSPNLSQKFLQFLKQNKAFTRSGSDPKSLNTIDDFAQFSGTTTENLIRSQYKNFLEYLTKSGIKLSKGGTVFGQGSQTTDSVPAMLSPGEEVIRASAANQFRPLLKDINDNAGRMFVALSNSITTQTKNNQIQEETNTKFTNLIEDFNKQLEDLIQKQRMPKSLREKLEEISGGSGSVLMGGPKQPTTSQTLKVTATPKSAPKSIQTYRRSGKSSGSGQPTIVNMPMPAMNLAGNQAPEAPNTNVHEPSTAPISISSFDSNNPYIAESLADYGIFI